MGQEKWRVGDYPSLPDMWAFKLQPCGSRRQPDEIDVDRNETTLPTALSIGETGRNDSTHGRSGTDVREIAEPAMPVNGRQTGSAHR